MQALKDQALDMSQYLSALSGRLKAGDFIHSARLKEEWVEAKIQDLEKEDEGTVPDTTIVKGKKRAAPAATSTSSGLHSDASHWPKEKKRT